MDKKWKWSVRLARDSYWNQRFFIVYNFPSHDSRGRERLDRFPSETLEERSLCTSPRKMVFPVKFNQSVSGVLGNWESTSANNGSICMDGELGLESALGIFGEASGRFVNWVEAISMQSIGKASSRAEANRTGALIRVQGSSWHPGVYVRVVGAFSFTTRRGFYCQSKLRTDTFRLDESRPPYEITSKRTNGNVSSPLKCNFT